MFDAGGIRIGYVLRSASMLVTDPACCAQSSSRLLAIRTFNEIATPSALTVVMNEDQDSGSEVCSVLKKSMSVINWLWAFSSCPSPQSL